MSLVRTLFFAGLLAVAGPVVAGGAFHGGVGFHSAGFHGAGFHGGLGFHEGRIGFGFRGHREFFGIHGFFAGLHLGPGGKGQHGYRYYGVGYGSGYAYPGNYGSSYNRYGWRKWWTYTDFSQINYPGVYPVTAKQPASRSQY